MTITTKKESVKKIINGLEENEHIEDIMERLYLLYKVEKGIQQANAGQVISHEEAKKRLSEWLK